MPIPIPTNLVVHQQSKFLELSYADGSNYQLSFEFLRVHSPSAEVRGHGPGQEVLQSGKREVDIVELVQVGNYAVQPTFSDGHNSGIFSWDYLYHLGAEQDRLLDQYKERLLAAGVQRDDPMPVAAGASCGHSH